MAMSATYKFLKHALAANAALCLMAGASAAAAGDPLARFGTAATPAQIAAWNIDVRADGDGLPSGHGSVEEGQVIYDQKCAVCHGTFGDSGDYIQLAGGVGSLRGPSPVRTVGSLLAHATTLWDYINRAMPFPNSKTLAPDEVYALTAYVLNLNDIVPAGTTLDQNSLPLVQMPNRDGYTTDHGFMSIHGKPDVNNRACMHDCAGEVKISSQLPDGFAQQNYGDLSLQFRGLDDERACPAPRQDRSCPRWARRRRRRTARR